MQKRTQGMYRRRKRTFRGSMVRLGMMVVHSLTVVCSLLWLFISGCFRMLWYIIRQIGRLFCFFGRGIASAFSEHNRSARVLLKDVKGARKNGGLPFVKQLLRFTGDYIFGEHGILRTGFNYIMPVISLVFLFAIVKYGMGLDYAISVVCNGEELGIIASESEFEAAEAEVLQRINTAGEELDMEFNPVYSLRIVSDDDQYVSAQTLADKLMEGSKASLSEGYGVYVDGEFLGAVEDSSAVSDKMDEALAEYAASLSDLVNEVYYTKEIEYRSGIYLADSIMEPEEILEILTAEELNETRYVTQSSDTPELVAAKFGMTVEELQKRNPQLHRIFTTGMLLKVTTPSRYIPIAYTKNMTVTSYIDYESVTVETSALNLGVEKVLSHGVMGERTSEVLVTYVDGAESSREVLSTVITKEPVPEQIGIGTYTPQPASSSTVIMGNGLFGWPVNGGYISDGYISDRNHKGVDIAAPYGTEIYAAGAGTVVAAGWNSGGYGNYVIIEHEDGYRTLYGHCSLVIATEGQEVEKGQLIAYVGSTGDSTGNHCHFEVRINNICTNPFNFLRVNAD